MRKSCEYEFTEQSLNVYSNYGNVTVPWTDLVKWKETDKMFFIYQTRQVFQIIPKRIFTTPEEQQTLRTYLTHALGPAK